MVKSHVQSALRHVLRPLVRLLLRNGVTWSEFADTGKEVFVQTAREDYGIQGRPTNTSRVALMTGLSRREVARVKEVLSGEATPLAAPASKISQILTAWHADRQFQDAKGRPLELPAGGESASIAALLKQYAGDMPHGAVIKELEELGLIERTAAGFRVLAREYIRSAADPDRIRQASVALHDHAATISYNVDTSRAGPPRFERMATHRNFPRQLLPALERHIDAEGRRFLASIDEWMVANAASVEKSARTSRVGVGMYLIRDEAEGKEP